MDVRIGLQQSFYKSWWRKLIHTILNGLGLNAWIGRTFDFWFMPAKVVNYDPPIPFTAPLSGPRDVGDLQLQHDGVVHHFSAKTGVVTSNTYAKGRHGWAIGHTLDARRTYSRHEEFKDQP